jgi:hypothetical protein
MNKRESITVENDIKQLQKDLEDIKKRQFTTGDSWIFYRIQTDQPYDISFIITVGQVINFRVTFTSDTDKLTAAQIYYVEDYGGPTGIGGGKLQVVPTQNGANHQWDFHYIANSAILNYHAKILIFSTQSGTISVEPL